MEQSLDKMRARLQEVETRNRSMESEVEILKARLAVWEANAGRMLPRNPWPPTPEMHYVDKLCILIVLATALGFLFA